MVFKWFWDLLLMCFLIKTRLETKKWKYEKPMVSVSKIDVFKVSGR